MPLKSLTKSGRFAYPYLVFLARSSTSMASWVSRERPSLNHAGDHKGLLAALSGLNIKSNDVLNDLAENASKGNRAVIYSK